MIMLRAKRFCRSNSSSKLNGGGGKGETSRGCGGGGGKGETSRGCGGGGGGEIKWELRPGGLLVQKRDNGNNSVGEEGMITLRVSTVTHWHHISIKPTSTFGELKRILKVVTGLDPREQRVLYRGKEREDAEFLHMVGVKDMDKVLVLEDPAIKETKKKLHSLLMSSSTRNNNQQPPILHNPPPPRPTTITV